ncbi:MAG: type II toxin-antitoxin system death-on-curing family toxin [Candidatus Berkelbacteria bacterium]|nr:type II toxin-antitoxin system death-on-curing family toxin [Candidatus Berkelbacteria bacterium]
MATYVSIGQVLAIHAILIENFGGSDGVRDIGLVESALARPQAAFGGYDAYPTLFEKAAVLMQGLIKNHGFIDGNKRTGTAVMSIFIKLNGHKLHVTDTELENLAVGVAEDKLNFEELTTWLKKNSKKN